MAIQDGEINYSVYWFPVAPMNQPMNLPVPSPVAAGWAIDLLAWFDLYQAEHNLRPDFSNAGGLTVSGKDGEPENWYSDDGEDFDDWWEENREDHPLTDETITWLCKILVAYSEYLVELGLTSYIVRSNHAEWLIRTFHAQNEPAV